MTIPTQDKEAANPVPAPAIGAASASVVGFSYRRPWLVIAACALLTVLFGWFAANNLGMDTDTTRLLDPDLEWRRAQREIHRLFPQTDQVLVIVVDAASPDAADDAAAALTDRLRERQGLFAFVRRPDAIPFFRQNGLLFLGLDEVIRITDHLATAQPMIATLAADPSLNGLLAALNLALEGIQRGETDPQSLAEPLNTVADSVSAALAGSKQPLSWQTLLAGDVTQGQATRRMIIAKPVLDFSELSPGTAASTAVRAAARDMGLTPENGVRIRLTGPVALNDEEFATVRSGAGIATLLSGAIVLLLLFLALRSFRPIFAISVTLIVGLIWTLAFAAATVGDLNAISVAFAVMFIGIAVDFGIQVSVRYRDERYRHGDPETALRLTGRGLGGPLVLAAVTTALGFLAFVPTAYRGVAELGVIAGAGMLVALALNLTLLPALLAVLRPPGERAPVGFQWAGGLDRFVLRYRRPVMMVAAGLAVLSLIALPFVRFDFNPLNLKDRNAESVSTLFELMADRVITPNTLNVLVPTEEETRALAKRLAELPEVLRAISIFSFIPEQQEEKLALTGDAAFLLLPTLEPSEVAPPADPATVRRTLDQTIERLRQTAAGGGTAAAAATRLADELEQARARGDEGIGLLQDSLLAGLDNRLDALRQALQAAPVSFETLPEDLKRDWITPDGRYRIEIYPRGDSNDSPTLVRFVNAVEGVAPDAAGMALTIQESGRTVWNAFQTAGAFAFVCVTLLLAAVLRRLRDVALVLAPLFFAALLTALTTTLIGLSMNFANVIALPLLFGIGVAYSIYFVMNWRAGRADPLQSSTARAVLFSGLTTLAAFGSLALASHPGMAAIGELLTICLVYTLVSALLLLPALLGPVRDVDGHPRGIDAENSQFKANAKS